MPKVEVNYQVLRTYANMIEEHCDLQEEKMKAADTAVKGVLGAEWFGQDTMAFGDQWEGVDASGSIAVKLKDSLNNYADALRACADAYQSAQEDAYNRSCLLPRW
jgi:uncharacterized protein YukE